MTQDSSPEESHGLSRTRAFFSPARMAPREAVKDMFDGIASKCNVLALDLKVDPCPVTEVATWIAEFKNFCKELAISKGKPDICPTFVIFADRFTHAEKKKLRGVGAVLFDRSRQRECQTADQLIDWLERNRQITLTEGKPAANLPVPPAEGMSPEDLKAVNSYPPGMTEDKLLHILKVFNAQAEGKSDGAARRRR